MEEFLKELMELCKKHNIGIGGCGCDGSPFLFNLDDEIIIGENLEYDFDKEEYKYTKFFPHEE